MEPCGSSACISYGIDISPSNKTLNFLSERNELINLIRLVSNSNLDNLFSKPRFHVVLSKTIPLSKNTVAIDMSFSKFNVKSGFHIIFNPNS